jgi:hypothetical protein
VAEAGTVHHLSLGEIRDSIAELGFEPRQRSVQYELFDAKHEAQAIEANHRRYGEIRAAQQQRGVTRASTLVPLSIVAGDSTA